MKSSNVSIQTIICCSNKNDSKILALFEVRIIDKLKYVSRTLRPLEICKTVLFALNIIILHYTITNIYFKGLYHIYLELALGILVRLYS